MPASLLCAFLESSLDWPAVKRVLDSEGFPGDSAEQWAVPSLHFSTVLFSLSTWAIYWISTVDES